MQAMDAQERIHLPIPANTASQAGSISVFARLAPQATELISLLNTLNGLRDRGVLVALCALAHVRHDYRMVDPPCVACHGCDQLCIRAEGSCAWCIAHGHECYSHDGESLQLIATAEEPDAAAELLDAVIARVLEHMRAEAPAYVSALVCALLPRLPSIVQEIAPGRISPAAILAWGRAFVARMRTRLSAHVEDSLLHHVAQYRATLGPYALGIVRGFMWGGARGVEDLPLVVQGVGNSFRQMRAKESPTLQAFLEAQARREVEAEVVARGWAAASIATRPDPAVRPVESATAEAKHEVIAQVLGRLPALKVAVVEEVLAEARLQNWVAAWVKRNVLKRLDEWEVGLPAELGKRVPLLRPTDVQAWVAVCEARVKEEALGYARKVVARSSLNLPKATEKL